MTIPLPHLLALLAAADIIGLLICGVVCLNIIFPERPKQGRF